MFREFVKYLSPDSPESLRKRLGIVKDDLGLYWKSVQNRDEINSNRLIIDNRAKPKTLQELAIACELQESEIAWEFKDINPGTKFINTHNLSNDQISILTYTAESKDVQLQRLRECVAGDFPDVALKISSSAHLDNTVIEFITQKYNILYSSGTAKQKEVLHTLCENILESPNPNKELAREIILVLFNFLSINLVRFTGNFRKQENFPTEVLDKFIDSELNTKNQRNLDEFLSHPNTSSASLLKVAKMFVEKFGELSNDDTNYDTLTISIILQHPNTTPEIVKFFLDKFNALDIPLQMKYLKYGLMNWFYNNPNIPEKPFTKLDQFSNSASLEDSEESLQFQELNELQKLFYYTKNLIINDRLKTGVIDGLIFCLVTEPKFPLPLQVEFFKCWFNENSENEMRKILKGSLDLSNSNLASTLYEIVVHKNTPPEILNLFFDHINYLISRYPNYASSYLPVFKQIQFLNPNLILSNLFITDIRTNESYYNLTFASKLWISHEPFFDTVLQLPTGKNSEDYKERAQSQIVTWFNAFGDISKFEGIKNILSSLSKIPNGELILSPEIFQILTGPNLVRQDSPEYLEFCILLIKRPELEEVYNSNPKIIQDWIEYTFDLFSDQYSNYPEHKLLEPVSKSPYTPNSIIQKILNLTKKINSDYLLDLQNITDNIENLLQNPNLDADTIEQIIFYINKKDTHFSYKLSSSWFKDANNFVFSPTFQISPQIWQLIINHPNTNHSTIGEIYARADDYTKKSILELYTKIDAFKNFPDSALTQNDCNILRKIPFQIWPDLIKLKFKDANFKNIYLYLRNYWLRNSPENPDSLKAKTGITDTVKLLFVENLFPVFKEIVARTPSNYLPKETTNIEPYKVHANNESDEQSIAKILNPVDPTSIPNLLATLRSYVVNGGKVKGVAKFLTEIDFQIDHSNPLIPVLKITGTTGGLDAAESIIKSFHLKKDTPNSRVVDFGITEASDLDKSLEVFRLRWNISVNVYNFDDPERALMIHNIKDKLTIFRDVLLKVVTNSTKTKIEESESYFNKAHEYSVLQLVDGVLGTMEKSENELQEWLQELNRKLSDPDFLAKEMDKEALARIDQTLAENTPKSMLNGYFQKKTIILEAWQNLSIELRHEYDSGKTESQEKSQLDIEHESILKQLEALYFPIELDPNTPQRRTSRGGKELKISEPADKLRTAINSRFNEHSEINNLLENTKETENFEETRKVLGESLSSLTINRTEVIALKDFFGKKLPIINPTIFGGTIWKIKDIKLEKQKLLKSDSNPQHSVVQDATILTKKEKERPTVDVSQTPGVLHYLERNVVAYENILKCTDLPENFKTEIHSQHLKTLILIETITMVMTKPETKETA